MTVLDTAGHVEVRGIEPTPEAERHGAARELFPVWAASNINYVSIVLGGTLVLLGLDLVQALVVVVVGNLFWALIGVLATSGAASGTPSAVVMRAMFGVRANRVNVLVIGWGVCVAYVAINISVGALAGVAFGTLMGAAPGPLLTLAAIAVVAAVMLTISVYGHATIVRTSGIFTAVLLVCIAALAVFVVGSADISYVPAEPPTGGVWTAALVGLTIVASGPLSWGTSADYARYLPATTSPRAIAVATALGGFLPTTGLGVLGVLAGTAVDMTDPQTSLAAILPGWFYPVFLLVVVLGSITNGVLTMYSSGLALQAAGIRTSRARTVALGGGLAIALTVYALLVSNFIDTLSAALELSVALLGPNIAIYATDVLQRRRYDGSALSDETPGGPFWFHHGVNPAGVGAQLAGTAVALMCINTTPFVGPIATALGGADLSTLAGPAVAAAVYAAFGRARSQEF